MEFVNILLEGTGPHQIDIGIAIEKAKDIRQGPYLLAETEGDIEAVLFGNLPIELPHCGHASVSAAGVRTAGLDRLQVRSEEERYKV